MTKTCPTCDSVSELNAMYCHHCGASIVHLLGDTESTRRDQRLRPSQAQDDSFDMEPDVDDNLVEVALPPDFVLTTTMLRDGGARLGQGTANEGFFSTDQIAAEYFRRYHQHIQQESAESPDREQRPDSRSQREEQAYSGQQESVGLTEVIGAVIGGVMNAAGITGDWAREGSSMFGSPLLRMHAGKIYGADDRFGSDALYRIEGTRLYESGFFGKVLARLENGRVSLGDGFFGRVIARVDGQRVYAGDSTWGQQIAHVESGNELLGMAAAYYLFEGNN